MEKYFPLKVYGYQHHGKNARELEAQNRFKSYNTYRTRLAIWPESKRTWQESSQQYRLFVMLTPKLFQLSNQVYWNSYEIKDLVRHLPHLAATQLFDNDLAKEIKSTNDIENVRTTTREIVKAVNGAKRKSGRHYRLQSFAHMYLKIKTGSRLQLDTLQDIRHIYDQLLFGEIAPQKLPDGRLFRTKRVRIGTLSKTTHTPPDNEPEIDSDLRQWLLFLHHNPMPVIFKLFVAHYYFEYVHPFYDGNGRTGRYILDMGLAKTLDKYTAVSFSAQVNTHEGPYYRAIHQIENIDNYGEATFFVQTMLKIVQSSQTKLISGLKRTITDLRQATQKLAKWFPHEPAAQLLIKTLFQQRYFGDFDIKIESIMSRHKLLQIVTDSGLKSVSQRAVKRILNRLVKQGVFQIVGKSPLKYVIQNAWI